MQAEEEKKKKKNCFVITSTLMEAGHDLFGI
jgi:hypothetical protein